MKQKSDCSTWNKNILTRLVKPRKSTYMRINGISVDVEKPRKGTRCAFCGEPIGDFDFIQTSTNHQTSCFVHRECIRERGYHETFYTPGGNKLPLFDNTRKATTREQIIYTPELEFNDYFELWSDEKKAAFVAQFKVYVEHDCTVGGEGHVASSINFHGMFQWYANLETWVDMTTSNCGHHMNFSWYGMRAEDVRKIRRNASEIFNPVEQFMHGHERETVKVFGRYFGRWAQNDYEYVHGSWVNLEHDFSDSSARVEFRLPHYVNAKQIVWCAFMLKNWMKELRKFCNGEQNARNTGAALLRHMVLSVNGKALYQRPERNGNAKKAAREELPFD